MRGGLGSVGKEKVGRGRQVDGRKGGGAVGLWGGKRRRVGGQIG